MQYLHDISESDNFYHLLLDGLVCMGSPTNNSRCVAHRRLMEQLSGNKRPSGGCGLSIKMFHDDCFL